jgi:RsiW-degrading membrane proteinase PrsW (M82 family)
MHTDERRLAMNAKIAEWSRRTGWGPATAISLFTLFYLLLLCLVVLVLIPKTGPALLFPAYFLLGMLLVTAVNRSLPVRWVVFCFLYGAILVSLVTILLSWPLAQLLGRDSRFFGCIIGPLLEESLKVVPLLVLLRLRWWRFRWTAGASDLMILGAAVGGGFAFFEDFTLNYMPGLGMSAARFLMETHQATPHLGPFYLFPSMDIGYSNSAFIGHTAATAFVGLCLGLARMLASRRGKWVWILPLWAWLWMVVDHGFFNFIADTGRISGFGQFLYNLDGQGRLSSIVFYLLVVGTLVFERTILARHRRRMKPFDLNPDNLKILKSPSSGVLAFIEHLANLRIYIRERRGLGYGLHHYHSAPDKSSGVASERRAYLEGVIHSLVDWKSRVEVSPSLTPDRLEKVRAAWKESYQTESGTTQGGG